MRDIWNKFRNGKKLILKIKAQWITILYKKLTFHQILKLIRNYRIRQLCHRKSIKINLPCFLTRMVWNRFATKLIRKIGKKLMKIKMPRNYSIWGKIFFYPFKSNRKTPFAIDGTVVTGGGCGTILKIGDVIKIKKLRKIKRNWKL